MLFVIIALRGILELVFWLLVGRGLLRILAGAARADNVVLRSFDFLLQPPRAIVSRLFPAIAQKELVLAALLIVLWLGLGLLKLGL